MKMRQVEICECCGAKIVEYKHVLNKGLVDALFRLSKHNVPMPLTELDITRNQWTNFQKLRYWGLVDKALHTDGTGTGNWFVTSLGRAFIDNQVSVNKNVWTFRGETVKNDGDSVYFNEVYDPFYRDRADYAKDARSHHGNSSPN